MWIIFISCNTSKITDSYEGFDSEQQDTTGTDILRPTSLNVQYIDTTRYPKAVCNDGSPPVYYIRPGIDEGINKWVIWFEGGGVCESQASCFSRWQQEKEQMSTCLGADCSQYKALEEMIPNGILSDDPEKNPELSSWNHVLFHYCSSDSWMGNRTDSISSGDITLWFRGHFIAEAMFSSLLSPTDKIGYYSLSDAEDIILAGSASGAIGVRAHLDLFSERIPTAKLVGLSDAGMVPVLLDEGMAFEQAILQQTQQLWNSFVDQSCLANHPQETHYCQQGAFLLAEQEITTPLFFHQDQADPQGYDLHKRAVGRELSEGEAERIHEGIRGIFQQNNALGYIPREGNSGILIQEEFNSMVAFPEGSLSSVFRYWYQEEDIVLITP